MALLIGTCNTALCLRVPGVECKFTGEETGMEELFQGERSQIATGERASFQLALGAG